MNLNRIRELAGIVSDRPRLNEGEDEVGQIIARQMGGAGKLRAFLGAKQIVAIPNGLRFKWPNRERSLGNVCVITLRPDDTYDMEFLNGAKSVKKYEGLYADNLVSTFEQQTGWYLSRTGPRLHRPPQEAKAESGELLSETTPSFVKHCVTSVAKKSGGDTQKAFAICVAQMQKAGYLEPGSMELTAAGKAKEAEHSAEPDAEKRVKDYEKVLKKARSESTEPECLTCDEAVGGVVKAGCECEGPAGCECEDTSRADMEKALWKWWPPDSKSTTGGTKKVMFTGTMAKAAGVLNYTTMPLSDLTDKNLKACYALLPKKSEALDFDDPPAPGHRASTEAKLPTYAQAQQDILAGLAKEGWTVKLGLKIPQAISPDASWKLFFKAQAIYLGQGAQADLGSARSLHLNDIRGGTYEKFKADLARWTKAESVEVSSEFRERAGLAGAHANWTLPTKEEKDSGFECMECGKKFKTVKAAEKAQENGCPKCGGSDIDLASPKKG